MDYPESDKGKCGTCGFLANRSRSGFGSPSPTYYEITAEERRNTSSFFRHWDISGRSILTDLACFRGIADLASEYSREVDETALKTKAMLALKRDRQCEGWYPYKTGFDPMEHFSWHQEQER